MQQRNTVFDSMKGLAILCMIIAHSPRDPFIWKFIHTWHMPLFFIISGFFFHPKTIRDYLQKNARQLLLPYIVVGTTLVALSYIKQQLTGGKIDGRTLTILGFITGSGTQQTQFWGHYSIGAIWFLQAMFWCRIIYNAIAVRFEHDKLKQFITIIIATVIANYIANYIFLPTNLLYGIQAMLFFYIGHCAQQYDLLNIYKPNALIWSVGIILCLLSVLSGSLSMAENMYGYWPINIIAAIITTYLIYLIVKKWLNCRFLAYCGRISLVMLCVHLFELTFLPIGVLRDHGVWIPTYTVFAWHIITTILLSTFLLRFKLIRQLFSIK